MRHPLRSYVKTTNLSGVDGELTEAIEACHPGKSACQEPFLSILVQFPANVLWPLRLLRISGTSDVMGGAVPLFLS